MTFLNLPSKSTIIGWLFELKVLKTRTELPVVDVVVERDVAVVTSGAGVVSTHSKSLQGQPAEQFSLKSY